MKPDYRKVLRSPFDIETHRDTFIHYLEVCIDPEGVVHYAVPSHERWLADRYMRENGVGTMEELRERLPLTCGLEWFCDALGCIAVWEHNLAGTPNPRQRATLRRLRLAGLYMGPC